MKPVMQKVIDSKNGDCFDACISSILETEVAPTRGHPQWFEWNNRLAKLNLQLVRFAVGSAPCPEGYCILSVRSAIFPGGRHAVVFLGKDGYGEIVHNPNPQDPRGTSIPNEEWLDFTVFAVIDAKATALESEKGELEDDKPTCRSLGNAP